MTEFDDTVYLAGMISGPDERVTIPRIGRPYFTRPLIVRGPKTIVFEPGINVEAIPEAFAGPGNCLLAAADQHDITIIGNGATLRMQCAKYEKALQWRHLISLKRCHNVVVQDLDLTGAGGDGIYVGTGCSDVTVQRVRCRANGRQGISVIGCDGLLIDGCTLEDTFGDWPGAGIDFEPNTPAERLLRCVVRDTVIRNNHGYGVLVNISRQDASSAPIDITMDRCVIWQIQEAGPAIRIIANKTCAAKQITLLQTVVTGGVE